MFKDKNYKDLNLIKPNLSLIIIYIGKIENLNKLKMHNHLDKNYHLSNKKALFYNIVSYC